MKQKIRLRIFVFTFFIAALGVIFPLSAYSQIAANRNQTVQSKSENESACLLAEIPKSKSKFIISFGQVNNRAIDIPKPEYSEAARAARVSGEVKVNILIGEKGTVIWARVKSGNPILQIAVKKVVCQARFKPITISAKPVSVFGFIVYNFVL